MLGVLLRLSLFRCVILHITNPYREQLRVGVRRGREKEREKERKKEWEGVKHRERKRKLLRVMVNIYSFPRLCINYIYFPRLSDGLGLHLDTPQPRGE